MISGKKIAIMGLGAEGFSAAKYLHAQNDLSIIDDKTADDINRDYLDGIKNLEVKTFFSKPPSTEDFDLVVRSPGVNPDHELVRQLVKKGAVLTSPTNIFFDQCKAEIIGVTGTKGKGTTSTLIYDILKTNFGNVLLGGNIGTPALDLLSSVSEKSKVVLELSSFQLLDLKKSPHISVILMVTSEHLDWHENQSDYIKAKSNIVKYQKNEDFAVINHDYENSLKVGLATNAKKYFFSTTSQTNGAYLEGTKFISKIKSTEEVCNISDVKIPGIHNYQNVLAAIAVAKIYNIDNHRIKKALNAFGGLPHRLQLVGTKQGVKYYNDSFSTTPETTIAAIASFQEPKVLILGGSSKNSNFSQLADAIEKSSSIKAIIFIGPEGDRIKNMLAGHKYQLLSGFKNMHQIVDCASNIAHSGDLVLLSPACASFGMFKNYKDRGDQFSEAVNRL